MYHYAYENFKFIKITNFKKIEEKHEIDSIISTILPDWIKVDAENGII